MSKTKKVTKKMITDLILAINFLTEEEYDYLENGNYAMVKWTDDHFSYIVKNRSIRTFYDELLEYAIEIAKANKLATQAKSKVGNS